MSEPREALRIEMGGIVQGVGFRPTVHRLAHLHGVNGWVRNDGGGLRIHAEGPPGSVRAFAQALREGHPPGARVDSTETNRVAVEGFSTFEILGSVRDGAPDVPISPDLPACEACLAEMHDPGSRRHLYPYINCTQCGPRYSIVRRLPYDRANTTLADWPLCPECLAEYNDPRDRRHHAQPTACNLCGPAYRLVAEGEQLARGHEAIVRAVGLLNAGRIVAVKGIGGYHLACSALDAHAVERLRDRKFRKEKPFAVMTRDLASASRLAMIDDEHRSLLLDPSRPIVLAPARAILAGVSPCTDEIGVMLPYAPLHALLFAMGAPDPLVMTSANRSSEPIAFRDDDAGERLHGIADALLVGERPIARRVDDSVMAVRGGERAVLRRSRGLAPASVARLGTDRPILALGADLKNAITLVVSGRAIASPHIGDLGDLETDRAFEETVRDLLSMYEIDPRELVIAHDLHPDFVSTRLAARLPCMRRMAIQHHEAHVASVLAERGEPDRRVIGIALDGTGYGTDASIWGFEFFSGSVREGFVRQGHLRPARLPGGDAAARWPVQAAAGFLHELDTPDLLAPPFGFPPRYLLARQMAGRDVRCFPTTSAGRLFDTVAALCGFTREVSFEGQAALWLEHQAHQARKGGPPYPFPDLDPRPLLHAVMADRIAGRDIGEIAHRFHSAVAHALLATASRLASQSGTRDVALSGGVFQSRLLRTLLADRSQRQPGLQLLFNREVPPNDGGISLGQAALASARAPTA